jgi:hypothetical protein
VKVTWPKFLDKRKSTFDSGSHQKEAGWQVRQHSPTLTQPTPNHVKRKESTMPNNTITQPHAKGETPNAIVNLTSRDIEPKDWAFLREWANILGVSIEVLLKRILVAAVIGQQYAEKIPES